MLNFFFGLGVLLCVIDAANLAVACGGGSGETSSQAGPSVSIPGGILANGVTVFEGLAKREHSWREEDFHALQSLRSS
jgi:hypothetical protein